VSGSVLFLTHAEVVIDPAVPIGRWGLNDVGRARHQAFAESAAVANVTSVWSSDEQKALDGAAPVAAARHVPHEVRAELGENDRSDTGYLPADEFWAVVAAFFAQPEHSVRGWERAVDAQARIVAAVTEVAAEAPEGDVLIVSHGGVATLLRCHLLGTKIDQAEGGPHPGGGNLFAFDRAMTAPGPWSAI